MNDKTNNAKRHPENGPTRRGNILIVDDTLANLRLLTDMLRQQGYVVRGAPNGEIALNAARANRPDIVLLDVNMPGMNGYEVCRQLKADPNTCDMPVIFLSALDEALDKVKAFEVGGVDYVSKPFQIEEVLVRIENHLKLEHLQKELRQARDEAEAASHAKSTFLANMSHEIRTPMNAILGYAQILLDEEGLSEKQHQAVSTIASSGEHLLMLINDVLDLSKIEAGREELHTEDFDLVPFLRELATVFAMRCQQKGLQWKLECDLGETPLHGDPQKLRQVLINLLGNAVKFTQAGRVVLSVRAEAENRFCFEVSDTGAGISAEHQERIFEPFHQEETGVLQGGTGLGLAIARRHTALMGGQLTVKSTEDEGSCFFFTLLLPKANERPLPPQEQWAQVERLLPDHRIDALVVDDVETNRDLLARLLGRLGVQVRVADGGAEALKAIRDKMPQIVFLDIRMPGMDGPQVLERILARYGENAPKVVATSASVLEHQQRSYLQAGFDRFLAKPIAKKDLCNSLTELLNCQFVRKNSAPDKAALAELPEHITLPAPLLDGLREAVKIHSMTQLQKRLEELENIGGDAQRLSAHLRMLSKRYDLKGVSSTLEKVSGG